MYHLHASSNIYIIYSSRYINWRHWISLDHSSNIKAVKLKVENHKHKHFERNIIQNIPKSTPNESGKRNFFRKCIFFRKLRLNMLFLSVYFIEQLIKRNVANVIKLFEVTASIAKLMNNVTFHIFFFWLVWLVAGARYSCNERNVKCDSK